MLTVDEVLKYIQYINRIDKKSFNEVNWFWSYPQQPLINKYLENDRKKIISIFQKKLGHKNDLNNLGLYVNIPFCKAKCRFCGFYSKIAIKDDIDEYINNLEKEINSYQKIKIDFRKIFFSSLYLGGGTPTILSSIQLKKLLKLLFKNFNFTDNSQKIIEGTPASLTQSKIEILEKFKFDRFTLGVQSFNDKILREYNRDSSVKDILEAYKLLRKSKIKYINIDMMLGLKGENESVYNNYLKYIKKLAPDQVSFGIVLPWASKGLSKKEKQEIDCNVREMELSSFFGLFNKMKSAGYQKVDNRYSHYYFFKEQKLGKKVLNYQLTRNIEGFYSVLGLGQCAQSSFFMPRGDASFVRNGAFNLFDNNDELLTNHFDKTAFIIPKNDVLRRHIICNFSFFNKIKISPMNDFFKSDVIAEFKNIFQPLLKDKMIKIDKNNLILLDNYKKLSEGYNLTERERYFFFIVNYIYPPEIHQEIRDLVTKKEI